MSFLIPQNFIDDVLARTSIVDLIDGYVPLKKSGSNYKACCPFHGEKTPSFTVSDSKQFYHCFGCGAGGNAISFLVEYDLMTFPAAVESLASRLGMSVPKHEKAYKRSSINVRSVIERLNDLYKQRLLGNKDSKVIAQVLKAKGMTVRTAIDNGAGFAPQDIKATLESIGLTPEEMRETKNASFNFNSNEIVFPVHNRKGEVLGWIGESIVHPKTPHTTSLSPAYSPENELYGLYDNRKATKESGTLILCERPYIAGALKQYGINNVCAPPTTTYTTSQLQLALRESGRLVSLFPSGVAGKQRAWMLTRRFMSVIKDGHEVSFMFTSSTKNIVSAMNSESTPNLIPLPEYFIEGIKMIVKSDESLTNTQATRGYIDNMQDSILKKLICSELQIET